MINNLLQLLSQRRCLLVVDNLETLLDRERKWQDKNYQEFFRCWKQQGKNSTLLITTQDKPQLFQDLQQWYPLGGMKITEGVELFKKFKIVGTDDELKAFVKYLNGHPLAIKLVAGFLINYCDSQFSQAEELQLEQFDLAYDEASGSHRKQEDARLSWIIQQHLARLTLEQTEFLFSLSVYRLPFNRKAASYMLREKEAKPIVVERKLQELCNRSLLTKTEDRKFQFESLVQKYVLQQANTLTNAHQQAIEYYQANLKESGQVLEDVSEYLEIIDHRCELEQYAAANKVLDSCWFFLELRGYYKVLVKIFEKLIQRWQPNLQPEDKSDYANALNNLGNAYESLGEYQQGIDYLQQSLEIKQTIGDRQGEANSLGNLGNAYESLGEYQQGIDYLQQSLEIKQTIGDRKGEASSLNNLGVAYNYIGEYQQAIDYLQQSLEIQQEIGDRKGEASSLNNLGNAYRCLRDYQQAIDYLQQSLEIQRAIGVRKGEADSLNNLGVAYKSLGEYPRAIDNFQQSLEIQQTIGDRNGEANSLMSLGNVYSRLGEYPQAIDNFQQSLEIQRAIGDRNGEADSLNNLGVAYSCLGDYQRGIDYLQQSLEIKQTIGNRKGVASSLANLGNAYNCLGEYPQAIDNFQQSLEIQREIGDKRGESDSWFNLGNTRKNLQQKSEAVAAYEKAKVLYQEMGLDKNVEKCDEAIQDLG